VHKPPLLENWKEHYEDIRPKFGKSLQADQTKEFWVDLIRDILTHIARFLALIYSKGKNILLWYKKRRLVAKKRPHKEFNINIHLRLRYIMVGLLLLAFFHPHSKIMADPVQPVKHEIPMAKKIPQTKLQPQEEVAEVGLAPLRPSSSTLNNNTYSGSGDASVDWIISHESGGDPNSVNASSGACGLFQKLPCNVPLGDVDAQMADGLAYIHNRYGSPANAVAFWQSHGWY
jgi:hypothetical protein